MKYKILNFSTLIPGPYILQQLMPNEVHVTKVEDVRDTDRHDITLPHDGYTPSFAQLIAKSQHVVPVNFRDQADIDRLNTLIKESDVVIENMRPGRMSKLGFSYEECHTINPRIVYCSISNFGFNHALSRVAMRDLNILGYSGALTLGKAHHIPHIPLADIFTSYHLTIKILSALLRNTSTHLHISAFEVVKSSLAPIGLPLTHAGREFNADEVAIWGNYPCYTLYETKDGKHMALAAIERSVWSSFCDALGITKIGNNQFDTSPNIRAQIAETIRQKTQEEWTHLALDCFTPVLSYLESLALDNV